MLQSLRIRNIGVIDDTCLEFAPGFTALTGETGAGKTMVLTGLAMLLGVRLDATRAGAGASVEGILRVEAKTALADELDALGAEVEDGEVIISRRVTADGRSRAHIGGVTVPLKNLAAVVGSVVTLHGQADQLRLRDADTQRVALDSYAGENVQTLRAKHGQLLTRHRSLLREIQELRSLLEKRDERSAVLTALLEKIAAVDPQPDEQEELRVRQQRLTNAVELRSNASAVGNALLGSQDAYDAPSLAQLLDSAVSYAQDVSRLDDTFAPFTARLEALRLEVSDLGSEVVRYADSVEASPGALEEINQRIHDLNALVRDVSAMFPQAQDIPGVLSVSASAAGEVDRLQDADGRLAKLEAEAAELETQLSSVGAQLTAARREAAQRLSAAATAELAQLMMPHARFSVEVSDAPRREHGCDAISFLLTPHPGAPASPIAKGASGGELSRIMLALEVALAESESSSHGGVFVFDEIDAGIGGRAARAVGQRLARLADTAQVIVVTHLPQVAACANRQLSVVKEVNGENTISRVIELDETNREAELARMLSGDDTQTALAHARELLRSSK
ncbi:DNA repair protein RecN [Dermabacteraceae bacterium P13147]